MSSTNPQPSHGTISSAKPGQQIQIQIQQAPQHKNDPAEHQQIHRPTLLRPIKTNLTIPGVSVGGSHKTIQRQQPQSILHISSKFSHIINLTIKITFIISCLTSNYRIIYATIF